MGKGRTTTGMILACLLKDMLFGDPNIKYYKDDKVTTEEFPDEDEYLEEVCRIWIWPFGLSFLSLRKFVEEKLSKCHGYHGVTVGD